MINETRMMPLWTKNLRNLLSVMDGPTDLRTHGQTYWLTEMRWTDQKSGNGQPNK